MNAFLVQAKLFAMFTSLLFGSPPTPPPAQNGEIVGNPQFIMKGITRTVADIMYEEATKEPDLRFPHEVHEQDRLKRKYPINGQNPLSPPVSQWPPARGRTASAVPPGGGGHHGGGPRTPQTVGLSFEGMHFPEGGNLTPPDSDFAVGPTQIVVGVNCLLRTFNKTTGVADGALNVNTNTFFSAVGGNNGTSDPMVRFDKTSNRWYIIMLDVLSLSNHIMIAVSSGPTITSSSSFTFYSFVGHSGEFSDYPSLGVDANALYIGCNMFSTSAFLGCDAWVIRKSALISGSLVVTPFPNITTGSGAGMYTPRGVDNPDPAATEGYFIGVDNASFGLLVMKRVTNPGGVPVLSANMNITVPTTVFPQDFAAQGGSTLDSLDDRIFYASMHKNKITGLTTLWCAHNIEVDTTGVANTAGNRDGARWYELQNLTTTPTLRQSGTQFDPAASNPRHHTIPSVNMSGQGHMALGCSIFGNLEHAEVGVSGRLRTDALGSIQADTVAQTSSTAISNSRWGDYSITCVDPNDDMTMWTIQEYCSASNVYAVRVVQLIAPPPATPATCVPASMAQGATGNVTLTGTSASGSEFYDPDSNYPNHIAAAFSGTGITVNSVTFTDPTHITLNITVSGAAATGARNLTVTNPDGQQATGNGIFSVTSGNNPVPTITSISPTNTLFGGVAFTLTVNGTNFVSNSVVRWNGADRATSFVNSGQVTATVTVADIAAASSTGSVTVFNPAPGGGTSNAATFVVNPWYPTGVTRITGSDGGGTLASLFLSDDDKYATIGDPLAPSPTIEVTTTAPLQSASQLQFVVESSSSRLDMTERISLFNYSTNLYGDANGTVTFAPTGTDSTTTKTVTTNVNQFIQSPTKLMKTQIRVVPASDVAASDGWLFSVDRAYWIFTP